MSVSMTVNETSNAGDYFPFNSDGNWNDNSYNGYSTWVVFQDASLQQVPVPQVNIWPGATQNIQLGTAAEMSEEDIESFRRLLAEAGSETAKKAAPKAPAPKEEHEEIQEPCRVIEI